MTRLFPTIVACGAALAGLPLACASEPLEEPARGTLLPPGTGHAGGSELAGEDRCRSPDGGCVEHCAPLADGGCLDPCFVHTTTCSPDCLELDGACGWPPTK